MSKHQMKVAFFTPYINQNRGNSTTAKRIISGLRSKGMDVVVVPYDEKTVTRELLSDISECDMYHILHFSRFVKWAKQARFILDKPYVLTNGGTDINQDLQQEDTNLELLLRNADAITVFTNDGRDKVLQFLPDLNERVHVISQSIWFPVEKSENNFLLPEGSPKILLPSGLRKIKDVLFLKNELLKLYHRYPNMQFIISGAVLEEAVHLDVINFVKEHQWAHFMENIPLKDMKHLYKWADIVINTSISEGQPIALLEAMHFGATVFARTNPGNQSVIIEGENGYLFENGDKFLEKIIKHLKNKKQQEKITERAMQYIKKHHEFNFEIELYYKLYKKIYEKAQ